MSESTLRRPNKAAHRGAYTAAHAAADRVVASHAYKKWPSQRSARSVTASRSAGSVDPTSATSRATRPRMASRVRASSKNIGVAGRRILLFWSSSFVVAGWSDDSSSASVSFGVSAASFRPPPAAKTAPASSAWPPSLDACTASSIASSRRSSQRVGRHEAGATGSGSLLPQTLAGASAASSALVALAASDASDEVSTSGGGLGGAALPAESARRSWN
mmetsp:Transcript_4600/g.18710  ORF Transcript_4600/g.18710 Transcript_4600/m.18710 type:complete len:218 (-) Transcript_4600:687-1340(-)